MGTGGHGREASAIHLTWTLGAGARKAEAPAAKVRRRVAAFMVSAPASSINQERGTRNGVRGERRVLSGLLTGFDIAHTRGAARLARLHEGAGPMLAPGGRCFPQDESECGSPDVRPTATFWAMQKLPFNRALADPLRGQSSWFWGNMSQPNVLGACRYSKSTGMTRGGTRTNEGYSLWRR